MQYSPRALPWRRLAAAVAALATCLSAAGTAAAEPAAHARTADSPAAEATWSVRPADNKLGTARPHYTYTLPQGTRIKDAITVSNLGDEKITLKVYASDGVTTAAGNLDLLPADKKPTDLGAWIKPGSTKVTLAPQQSRTIPFTLTVPSAATPGDHTGGIVTSLVTKGSDGVSLDRRLGSRVYLRVPGLLTPALRVTDVHAAYDGTANPAGTGSTRITYTVTNTGNMRVSAHQKVHISGLFGAFSGDAALADLPEILPGNALTRTAVVAGVWPTGPLHVTVSATPVAATDAGGTAAQQPTSPSAVASGTATAWAWPWALALVVLLIALLVVATVMIRRRSRRKVAAAIEKAVGEALDSAPERKPEQAQAHASAPAPAPASENEAAHPDTR